MLDYQNLYRKDRKENIRIFSDLKTLKEFSSYNTDLNHVFGENTYNKFHKNLTEQRKVISDNFQSMALKPFVPTSYNKFEEDFNPKEFESSLNNMKMKEQILNYKVKNPYTERMKNSSSYLLRKEIEKNKANKIMKSFLPEVPEVGRYNPQYNSINKHSYRVFFGNKSTNRFNTLDHEMVQNENNNSGTINDKEIERNNHRFIIKSNSINRSKNINYFNKINKNQLSIRKLLEKKPVKSNLDSNSIYNLIKLDRNNLRDNASEKILTIKNSNSISHITDNISNNNSFTLNNSPRKEKTIKIRSNSDFKNKSKITNNSSTEIDKDNSLDKSIRSRSDNNHCLRFETYTSRKPMAKTILYNTDIKTELPNYYTSKYIKNNINYKKGKNIKSFIEQIISKKDQYPPIGFYQPKYNFVLSNIDKNIYLNRNKIMKDMVQNRLKKIFSNYNMSEEYQTVPYLNQIEKQPVQTEGNMISNHKNY